MIRRATTDDVEACVAVLASLPDHFTPDTHDDLRARFDACDVWVAEVDGEVVACALLERRYPSSGEIHYAGVRPDLHRHGIGRQLIEALFACAGVPVVEVKTLDASSGYEPYVATRAFWEAMGCVQIDCIDPLPGWQPGNPSAIYVKVLGT